VNLKYNYPLIVFVLAFAAIFYFSFKHDRAPDKVEDVAASAQERQDQLTLSAMHAEPAPASPGEGRSAPLLASNELRASDADLAQLRILDEVLAAHNDNDPRLDRELRALSPAAKALMRGRYAALATEKRNQRGTIVFLVGRDLSSADDVGFLHSVLTEPPCLSLSNCSVENKGSLAPEDHHHDAANEVTLAYPQLVAIKAIEAYLDRSGRGGAREPPLQGELEAPPPTPVHKVAALAQETLRKVSGT
jgi:hypothetical protein